jgi:hypothetical protein
MRFRPKLVESCTKSGPITTPRLGEGGGSDAACAAIAHRKTVFKTHGSDSCLPLMFPQRSRYKGTRSHLQCLYVHL